MAVDFSRLKSLLSNTKTQVTNNPLWQLLNDLIVKLQQLQIEIDDTIGSINSTLTNTQGSITTITSRLIRIIDVDTSTSPQTVTLATAVTGLTIIKDISGNASVNNITLTGTVDGVVNPVISTNFGVKRIYVVGSSFFNW